MSKTYIHYGHSEFSKELFNPIKNNNFVKPMGGFWASDINAKRGWIDWCRDEDFRLDRLSSSFKFKLSDNARVLLIEQISKLNGLPLTEEGLIIFDIAGTIYIDFEKLMENYDAIEVIISSDYNLYYTLYGWDCDSILIMNPDIVEPIK